MSILAAVSLENRSNSELSVVFDVCLFAPTICHTHKKLVKTKAFLLPNNLHIRKSQQINRKAIVFQRILQQIYLYVFSLSKRM